MNNTFTPDVNIQSINNRTIIGNTDTPLDFGDYCIIEQRRYGVENEQYTYKVIGGGGRANYYREVPVDVCGPVKLHGEMCDVVKVICCGVVEEKVETFRLQDVKRVEK